MIEPCKPPEMIACTDKGCDTDPFVDLDKDEDEDQTEENWASWVQSAGAKDLVFALV